LGAELSFAIPGDLATRTGGYAYDRRLMCALRARGWHIDHLALGASFPFPRDPDLTAAGRCFADLPAGSLVLADGLAFGAMPEIVEREADRLAFIALVHHPLAAETGLGPADCARLRERERRALAAARGILTTSATTARELSEAYGVAPHRLAVAQPGSDPVAPAQRRRGSGDPVQLLSVATLTHRKGHDLLIEALVPLADLPWLCRIVGSPHRAPETARDLRRRIASHGLESRILLAGEVDDIGPCYGDSDIFVLASRYEGYGIVFAEALRHGLPVIATRAGAIPEVVLPEAGILVPAEDVPALTLALARLIADPAERARYAAGARAAALSLPSWSDTAQQVEAALQRFAAYPPAARSGAEGRSNRQSNSTS
jgi:glycosyltransferase involved in cell wall biosynthesis